ncbi:MAG: TetR/AcrR family transcriptional regulator [Rhodobiaceae bacterium]|nr:TetR/AcrR family transcriptional regulator [Rhodobiaceae bacterium]
MATQSERRTATRASLISSAEKLFVTQGFEGTSTDDILAAAGVSRGAMYYHFPTKRDVFEAVFVATSDGAILRSGRAAKKSDSPLESLINACLSWLKEVRKPQIATILIDQAPQVLGWERARDLEAETSLGLMTAGLKAANEAGEIDVPSIELSARFLNAVLAEAALVALHSSRRVPQSELEASIRHFIVSLSAKP